VDVEGLTVRLELDSTVPMPPSIVTDAALVAFHIRVADSPRAMVVGDADNEMVGSGAAGEGLEVPVVGVLVGGRVTTGFGLHPLLTSETRIVRIATKQKDLRVVVLRLSLIMVFS